MFWFQWDENQFQGEYGEQAEAIMVNLLEPF